MQLLKACWLMDQSIRTDGFLWWKNSNTERMCLDDLITTARPRMHIFVDSDGDELLEGDWFMACELDGFLLTWGSEGISSCVLCLLRSTR